MWSNEAVREFAKSEIRRTIRSGKGSKSGGGFITSTYEPHAIRAVRERDFVPATYINDTGRVWEF